MDYINLLHASGLYEKQTAKIIPFRNIDIFENAVSAGIGNFLVDSPKETFNLNESIDVPSVLQPNDRTIPFDSEVPPAFPSLRRGPVPGQQPYRRLQSSAYGAQ